MQKLVLASGSPYRRELLNRLQLSYQVEPADIDETRRPNEAPDDYVARLAEQKARAVAGAFPDALIIGSDQAAVIGDKILGKPGTKERAVAQLTQASGRTVEFLTGLAVLNTRSGQIHVEIAPYRVHFRSLTSDAITRYVERERPFDCAGSFKAEGLGVALFERMEGDDPTALIGLPLIRLVRMLEKEGLRIP